MRRILSISLILALGFPQPAHALRAIEMTEAGTEETVARSLRENLSTGTEEKLAALVRATQEVLSSSEESTRHQALTELPAKIRETLGTGLPAGDPRLAPFVPMLVKAAADEKESFDNRDVAIWILRHTIRRPEGIKGIGRALGVPDPSERISDSALRGDLIYALVHTIAENEEQLKQIRGILRKTLLEKKGEPNPEIRDYTKKMQWEINGIFWEAARLWKTSPPNPVKNRWQALNGILLELGSFDGEAPLHLARENFAWILERGLRTEPDADQAFRLMTTLTDWLVELENLSKATDLERREKLRGLFTSVHERFKGSARFTAVLNRRVLPRLAPEAQPTDPPLVMKADAGTKKRILSRFRQMVNGPEVDAVVQAALAEGKVVDVAEKVQGLLEAARGAGYEGKLLFIPMKVLYQSSLEPIPLRLFVQELHRPVIKRNLLSAPVTYQEDPNLKELDFVIADFSFEGQLKPGHAPLLEVDARTARRVGPALLYYLAKYRPDLTRPGTVLVIGRIYTGDLSEGLLIFA